jgi:hypothetical protein
MMSITSVKNHNEDNEEHNLGKKIKRGIKASVKNNKPEEVTSLKTVKKTRIRL